MKQVNDKSLLLVSINNDDDYSYNNGIIEVQGDLSSDPEDFQRHIIKHIDDYHIYDANEFYNYRV